MGAAGFATLAGHFTDRTVVTYDPRGAGRSKRGAEHPVHIDRVIIQRGPFVVTSYR